MATLDRVPVTPTAAIVARLFGCHLGWSVSRDTVDRLTGARSSAVMTACGITLWLTSPSVGTDLALASVSMALAGATSTVVATAFGKRPA
jgi:hypothetical protein